MLLEEIWPWLLGIGGSFSFVTITFAIDQSNPFIFKVPRFLGALWRHIVRRKYFIAAPMTVTASDEEYARVHEKVDAIRKGLERRALGIFPFFVEVKSAVLDAPTKREFRPAREGFEIAAQRIKRCDYFVLLYPSAKPSSTLVETGIAVGFRKPIAVFYERSDDLPYVLREAQAAVAGVRFKSYPINSAEEFLRRVSRGHRFIFSGDPTLVRQPFGRAALSERPPIKGEPALVKRRKSD